MVGIGAFIISIEILKGEEKEMMMIEGEWLDFIS